MVKSSVFIAALPAIRALYLPFEEKDGLDRPNIKPARESEDIKANTAVNAQERPELAPLFVSPEAVANQFIVQLKDGVDPALIATHLASIESIHAENSNNGALEGFIRRFNIGSYNAYSGRFLPETIDHIRKSPIVEHVEQDGIGLARISHRKPLTLDAREYLYDDEGGEGVTAYVVDTGIYLDHDEFQGRAKWGTTIHHAGVKKDDHGHGTHCAGTIAGKTFGVAKKASLVAVKVLGADGSCTTSELIAAIEYVAQEHKKNTAAGKKGSTANMSIGGWKSPSENLAINAAVNQGVHFAVAAGNENQDACYTSPASASEPITVGASNITDVRASFSNYGTCVDIFAPGVNVLSAGIASRNSTQRMSGTSMATPHICGLLTYFLSLQPSSASGYHTQAFTPQQLKKHLVAFGTKGVLTDIDEDTPNVLAFNGGGGNLTDFYAALTLEDAVDASLQDVVDAADQMSADALDEVHHAIANAAEKFAEIF